MQQVTIGTKNQIVIPREVRKKVEGLKPGRKVNVYIRGKDEVVIKTDDISWIKKTAGLMTSAWKDISPVKELKKMRNEWEDRLTKYEKAHP